MEDRPLNSSIRRKAARWHFCATIDRTIAAWKGKIPRNPLMIKFLTETP